jgi:glycosyltransferase involved in cell wall biosynthesis
MRKSVKSFARRVCIVTSIHPDFDARIWKHATSLAAAGMKVTLICPWSAEAPPHEANVEVVRFTRARGLLERLAALPWRIGRLVLGRLRSTDVFHFHDIDLLPLMALVSLSRSVVYDVHENYPEEARLRKAIPAVLRGPFSALVRYGQIGLAWPIRNIVLVAPSQEEDFPGRRFNKLYVRNYASRQFGKATETIVGAPYTVVFSGSQHVNNGSLLLLEIAAAAKKVRPQIRFMAADRFTDRAFRASFLEHRHRLDLDDTVSLFKNVLPHQLNAVLAQASVAISPNLRVPQQINGVHTKLFEYMAVGLPIVASDLPHQVALIADANCGMLAKPEFVEDFASAIVSLLDDPNRAKALGESGRKAFFEKYSYEAQMPSLIRFYESIC